MTHDKQRQRIRHAQITRGKGAVYITGCYTRGPGGLVRVFGPWDPRTTFENKTRADVQRATERTRVAIASETNRKAHANAPKTFCK